MPLDPNVEIAKGLQWAQVNYELTRLISLVADSPEEQDLRELHHQYRIIEGRMIKRSENRK